MKIYYAHCLQIYGTPQEERDVSLLELLGFEVYNPNNEDIQQLVQRWKGMDPDYDVMRKIFLPLVETCDALAYRGVPDGRLPGGVWMEATHADKLNIPIIELPYGLAWRGMTTDQSREYLRETGQR